MSAPAIPAPNTPQPKMKMNQRPAIYLSSHFHVTSPMQREGFVTSDGISQSECFHNPTEIPAAKSARSGMVELELLPEGAYETPAYPRDRDLILRKKHFLTWIKRQEYLPRGMRRVSLRRRRDEQDSKLNQYGVPLPRADAHLTGHGQETREFELGQAGCECGCLYRAKLVRRNRQDASTFSG
jgi:hypothetical protein